MPTDEVVSGVLDGLNLNALDLSAVLKTAILILVGIVLIRILMKIVDRMLAQAKAVAAIKTYIRSAVRIGLWLLLGLMVAGSLNVDVTSIIALLSVAGLAVSLALQNTLSNLAGGIMILISKPFVVGDYVEADGVSGTVAEVGLAYSKFVTVDNKEIFIPNSQLSAAKVVNYTTLGRRRVEVNVTASYDAPTETVKAAIREVLAGIPQIEADPAPQVWVSAYQASSIEYVIRAWTAAGDYWDVYYALLEGIRPAFERNGVEMTYNHLNVHVLER